MTMTPEDVQATRFREGWRGYDEDEVDDFMSRVAHALQVVIAERDEARARADRLEQDADEVHEQERLLRRTLLTAERTAEETVERAQADAEGLRSEARADAERIRIEAHDRARHDLERAARTADEMRRSVAGLRAFRDEYADRVRAVVQEQLEALDRVGTVPDLPETAVDFEQLVVAADHEADETGRSDEGASLGTAAAGQPPASALDLDDLEPTVTPDEPSAGP